MGYTKFKKKYPKTANALETARHALTIAKGVASVINVEFKHIDTAGTTVNPTATGVVLPMNSCAEGTASYERNGLSVRNKSLFIRGFVTGNASATNTLLRIMVVKELNPNGATPLITDIIETGFREISLMNNINGKEFKVLYSKFITMSADGSETAFFEKYLKLNGHTKYNSSSGAATSIDYGGYYLVLASNQMTNTPTVNYTSRIRYVDN